MQTTTDLGGLRVAVTGGTSGLGLALVRQLTAQDARVVFVARTAANVERIASGPNIARRALEGGAGHVESRRARRSH